MNLGGGVQQIRKADSNIVLIEGINRLTEEFYKTLAILLYVRYRKKIDNAEIKPSDDIINLIQDYCGKPTFETWKKLGENCYSAFNDSPDKFSDDVNKSLSNLLEGNSKDQAKNVIKEIYQLKNSKINVPKKISNGWFLSKIQELRNFRAHHWDDNRLLNPLVDTGIEDLVICIINDICKEIEIRIIKPTSIEKNHVNAFVFDSNSGDICKIKIEENYLFSDGLSSTYIVFPDENEVFLNPTNLVYFDEDSDRIYVYHGMKKSNEAFFVNVPTTGGIEEITLQYSGQNEIFSLAKFEIENEELKLTLKQKFGNIHCSGSVIHNLPYAFKSYVSRTQKENELIDRLRHFRTHIISLSGGGGYGKTELVKQVLWDILSKQEEDQNYFPKYDLIVWISAKETKFDCGSIHEISSSFTNFIDLLDCILYVTNNIQFIKLDEDQKKEIVIDILNQNNSSLLVIDNLETIKEKKPLYNYLDQLLNEVRNSELKIIITSRVDDFSYGQHRLPVGLMEDEEASKLITEQISQMGITDRYSSKDKIDQISHISAKSPLLIIFVTQLLAKGYTLNELTKGEVTTYDKALEFICEFQWRELSNQAKNILIAISVAQGKCSFSQVRQMCEITDASLFHSAKEELSQRSFLIESELENSVFALLPPIYSFVNSKRIEYPDIDKMEREWKIINIPESILSGADNNSVYMSDDIQLQQLIQKAENFIRVNSPNNAQVYYNKCVEFFPDNPIAWRELAEFEFKYLEDDQKARSSFKKAIQLNPNDPITFTKFAYWEQNRGQNLQKIKYIQDSIEYNKKALDLFNIESSKRVVRDHIGSAYLKLGEIEKNLGQTSNFGEERQNHFLMADEYVKMAINIFENNIILNPKDDEEKNHNAIDYNYLAIGYIRRARGDKDNQGYWYQKALVSLINGLKEKPSHNKLLYTLGDYNIKRVLREKYRIFIDDMNRTEVQSKIFEISEKIEDDFGRMKIKQ